MDKGYTFQNPYPYGVHQDQQLDHIQSLHNQVERDIYDNNNQIRLLNNKIVKNDYDHSLMQKLQSKREILMEKRRELGEIVKNHQFLQQEINNQKYYENNYKQHLGKQYIQLGEQKKRKAQEERRKVIEQERHMHEFHRRALEQQHHKRKEILQEQKKMALEQLAQKEQSKLKQKQQKERQKEQYNRKISIRSQIETQKDSVYKQYYNHFQENQEQLHNIYRNKAAVVDRERQVHRNEVQEKELQEHHKKVQREQEERAYKMNEDKDMLRSFLKNQIEQKERKKSRQKVDQHFYHNQVNRHQISYMQNQLVERQRKKQEQRRYDEQLRLQQTRMKGYSVDAGNLSRSNHNPITNPIDFKIGITNPYIIKEYELTKEKYLGDSQLKLRNLAMIGSNSLNNQ